MSKALLEARIATLEAELAASRADAKLAWAEASMGPTEAAITHELAQSQAHANALRGVLEKHARLCAERGVEQPAYMQAALAKTPAASLAAHDAEVLERAVAEITNRCVRQIGESALIPGYNRCMDDVERAIKGIRALAAQEVKP